MQLWELSDTLYRRWIFGRNVPGPGDGRFAIPGSRRSEHDERKRGRCQFQCCHWKTFASSLNHASKKPKRLENCYQPLHAMFSRSDGRIKCDLKLTEIESQLNSVQICPCYPSLAIQQSYVLSSSAAAEHRQESLEENPGFSNGFLQN